jgi:E3 ubiquitin-protein ligase BAH
MKFNHEFQEALLKEGFPPHWVESAVPYGQLKKVIKKVKTELEAILKDLGLEPEDLVSAQGDENRGDGSVAFQYNFDGKSIPYFDSFDLADRFSS